MKMLESFRRHQHAKDEGCHEISHLHLLIDPKSDPMPSHTPDKPIMNPRPKLRTQVSFKGCSPPQHIQNPYFFLSFLESRGRDSF
jgi:hypothetical protein